MAKFVILETANPDGVSHYRGLRAQEPKGEVKILACLTFLFLAGLPGWPFPGQM